MFIYLFSYLFISINIQTHTHQHHGFKNQSKLLKKQSKFCQKSTESLFEAEHVLLFFFKNQISIADWFCSKINRSIVFFQSWSLWVCKFCREKSSTESNI